MTLVELGAALRAEREKRGLDIEDAANRLKIGARLLRALEEGDEASLPHLAYTKGFIRSYAAYVGLSAEEVSDALCALEAAAAPVTPQNVYEPEMVLSPTRNLKPILVGIVLLALCGGLFVAWQQGAFDFLGRQTRRLAQPAPMQSAETVDPANLTSRPAPSVATSPTQAPASGSAAKLSGAAGKPAAGQAPSQAAASAPQGATAAAPAASTAQQSAPGLPPVRGTASAPAAPATAVPGQPQGAPAQAGAAASASPAAAEPQAGPNKIIITATEECWVHSNADRTDTRQFSLHKGDTFALTFNKSLELKLGNAGGVRLRYNGEELPPVGQSGQVRTLTFPPADRQ